MIVKDYLTRNRRLIDRALREHLPRRDAYAPALQQAIRYSLFPGGKRLRPLLAIAAYNACGARGKAILPFACALEMLHTSFLIHDDLPALDNDAYRRGRLTVHKKFGEAMALIAGDALLILAFSTLSKGGDGKVKQKAIKKISHAVGVKGVIGGQAAEIEDPSPKKEKLRYIHRRKTGALIEAAVTLGAIVAGAGKKKIESLTKFGRDFGFSFQISDDLLDNNGYVKIWGEKKTSEKATALTRQAIKHLDCFGKKADALRELARFCLISEGIT